KKLAQRTGSHRVLHGQDVGQDAGASCGRKRRLSRETRNCRIARKRGQTTNDRLLIVPREQAFVWPKQAGVGQQGHRVLGVLDKALESRKQESTVVANGHANAAAKLLS